LTVRYTPREVQINSELEAIKHEQTNPSAPGSVFGCSVGQSKHAHGYARFLSCIFVSTRA
jgi:hypothetical protein